MRHWSTVFLGLALCTSPLAGQSRWTLGLEFGATRFSPAVHDTSAETIYIRPWHPTSFTLRLVRERGTLGLGLGAAYLTGPIGTNIGEFVLIPGPSVDIVEITPEVRWRFAGTTTGGTAHLSGGPVWDLYMSSGYDPVSRFGGQTAVTLSLPLTSAIRVDLRSDLTLTGSMFAQSTETDQAKVEGLMWRGRFGVGVALKL